MQAYLSYFQQKIKQYVKGGSTPLNNCTSRCQFNSLTGAEEIDSATCLLVIRVRYFHFGIAVQWIASTSCSLCYSGYKVNKQTSCKQTNVTHSGEHSFMWSCQVGSRQLHLDWDTANNNLHIPPWQGWSHWAAACNAAQKNRKSVMYLNYRFLKVGISQKYGQWLIRENTTSRVMTLTSIEIWHVR